MSSCNQAARAPPMNQMAHSKTKENLKKKIFFALRRNAFPKQNINVTYVTNMTGKLIKLINSTITKMSKMLDLFASNLEKTKNYYSERSSTFLKVATKDRLNKYANEIKKKGS